MNEFWKWLKKWCWQWPVIWWKYKPHHICNYQYIPCRTCHGTGSDPQYHYTNQCYWCRGDGWIAKCANCEVEQQRRDAKERDRQYRQDEKARKQKP